MMLESDRAVETKLGRRGVERCDGHRVVEDVVKPAKLGWARQDIELRADEPEIVTLARPEHHAMLAKSHRFRISVDRDVPHGQKPRLGLADLLNATFGEGHLTSSVQTVKPARVLGPNVLLIATSVASRPRAMSTRPIRGVLFRASNVCQRPPI